MRDHEISEGASDNECTNRLYDHKLSEKEDHKNYNSMAESRLKPSSIENGHVVHSQTVTKIKLDPKDPLRPRRKKARRACFACQRAHLTCGDERPCQRCIKRGLADACQDGVRKKAKYLHDVSSETLRPVLGPSYKSNFNQVNHSSSTNGLSTARSNSETSPCVGTFFPSENTSPSYPIYTQQTPMPPPLTTRISYGSQNSSMSPSFTHQSSIQCVPVPHVSSEARGSFNGPFFDPNQPAILNFDLEGINFGNHYGALEFGMMGHMSSGIREIPCKDQSRLASSHMLGGINFNNSIYGNSMSNNGQIPPSNMLNFGGSLENQRFTAFQDLPNAYAITTGSNSHHSPSIEASPTTSGVYEKSPTSATYTPGSTPHVPTPRPVKTPKSHLGDTTSNYKSSSIIRKRPRDSSFIYDMVREPYSYTTGFHSLTALLQRRFSSTAIFRIAKSLACIRPSFISCTKTLNRQDLIFMETCFQRTLFEYEEFLHNCCTPTIVCRRTGEIVAVNHEFTMMTGWRRDILLGQKANLNVNTSKLAMDTTSGLVKANFMTPRPKSSTCVEQQDKDTKFQPVFFAELLDEESVVQFYDDFARLAFNDSRGSAISKCKLLQYRPGEQNGIAQNRSPGSMTKDGHNDDDSEDSSDKMGYNMVSDDVGLAESHVYESHPNHGSGRHKSTDKLDCSYCWTIKRDVFDIPMLIVMNVSFLLLSHLVRGQNRENICTAWPLEANFYD
ncbi:Transcription activator of gluconeogenesis [Podosphaera aphanis]|nr:Transcription activator of gluconeogenesis [Podosphaera aphanis]